MRVFRHNRILLGLNENRGGGRALQKPQSDVSEGMIGLGEAPDDVGKSWHGSTKADAFMKMAVAPLHRKGLGYPP